jgi:propanol-preferring alcohol dehydrogenase
VNGRWIAGWGGPLLAGELPDPAPGDGEVLVEVEACGVGLTVLNCIRGDLAGPDSTTPRVPGHEYVGRIVGVGNGVDPSRLGERIAAYFYLFCGNCRRCIAGTESLCERLRGFVGVDIDGGYAPLATLPARNAVVIPLEIPAAKATAIPDAIATPVHVAERASIAPGERVVVIGAGGGVGVHMVQVAQLRGASVLGLESEPAKREALSSLLGTPCLDSATFDGLELPEDWKRGVDVVVDLLGSSASLRWSLDSVRENGRVVALTTFRDVAADVSPRELVFRQVSLLGSRYASRHEIALASELVASNRVRPFVSDVASAGELDELHQRLRTGEVLGRGALLWARSTSSAAPLGAERTKIAKR